MRLIETPQDMTALMKECIEVTYHFIDQANEMFDLHLPRFPVVFALKTGTAGRAQLAKGIIQYNPTLLRENPEAFLKRTTGHEVIHFAAYAKHRDAGHGPHWHRMMRQMGLDDTRCHSYDISRVPTRLGSVPNKRIQPVIKADIGTVRTFGHGKIIDLDD